MIAGSQYNQLVAKNDQPLSPEEQAAEEEEAPTGDSQAQKREPERTLEAHQQVPAGAQPGSRDDA